MTDFRFKIPEDVVFGDGAIQQLPKILNGIGCKNLLIVSDRCLEKLGIVGKIKTIAENAGIKCSQFLDVMPNPTTECVYEAVSAYENSGAEAILALGGGSPMDVAKTVGILAKYKGRVENYEGFGLVPGNTAPVVAIPTTAGTGSEVTPFAVIEDTGIKRKLSIVSPEIIPDIALLDPELIITLPAAVAAATGVDALVHAIEAYISRCASPFSDAMAEKAMELIGGNLRSFVACRQNISAAGAMMSGSMFAGLAFSFARLGNVHAMSHPVSAYYNVPHGTANAILLPTVLEYNELADCGRYRKIYEYISRDKCSSTQYKPGMLSEEVRQMISDLRIPLKLSDVGVGDDKISQMALDAMKSGNILSNPRQSGIKDIEMLYKGSI